MSEENKQKMKKENSVSQVSDFKSPFKDLPKFLYDKIKKNTSSPISVIRNKTNDSMPFVESFENFKEATLIQTNNGTINSATKEGHIKFRNKCSNKNSITLLVQKSLELDEHSGVDDLSDSNDFSSEITKYNIISGSLENNFDISRTSTVRSKRRILNSQMPKEAGSRKNMIAESKLFSDINLSLDCKNNSNFSESRISQDDLLIKFGDIETCFKNESNVLPVKNKIFGISEDENVFGELYANVKNDDIVLNVGTEDKKSYTLLSSYGSQDTNSPDSKFAEQPDNREQSTRGGFQNSVMPVKEKTDNFLETTKNDFDINFETDGIDRENFNTSLVSDDLSLDCNKDGTMSGISSSSADKTSSSEPKVFSMKNDRICPFCSKNFKFPSKLKQHIHSHSRNQIFIQNKKNNRTSLELVYEKVETASETKKLCTSVNSQKGQQLQSCSYCPKFFRFASKLKRHVNATHKPSKPYTCVVCLRTFSEKHYFVEHTQMHDKERTDPHICGICNRVFSFKTNLKRHIKSHNKEKTFICDVCGRSYSSEKRLMFHTRVHTAKSHKCITCGKVFKTKSNLNRHIKIHSNDRAHPCSQCDYKASQKYHLERHIRRNHIT